MDLKNLKKLILTSKFPSQGHAFQFLLRWAVEDLDEVEHLDFYDFLKNECYSNNAFSNRKRASKSLRRNKKLKKKDLCGLHAHLLRKWILQSIIIALRPISHIDIQIFSIFVQRYANNMTWQENQMVFSGMESWNLKLQSAIKIIHQMVCFYQQSCALWWVPWRK